jgi:hypothetical protein
VGILIQRIIGQANNNNNNNNLNTFQTFKRPFPSITFNYTSTKEIEEIIKSLKTKHSHGYDEIPTKILKLSASFISYPLTYMCNKQLSSGMFQTRLKFSVVKPTFKNGDKFNISNYRPISLLTVFSKVLHVIYYYKNWNYTG